MHSYPSQTFVFTQHEIDSICIALEQSARTYDAHGSVPDARLAAWLRELRDDIRAGYCSPRTRERMPTE